MDSETQAIIDNYSDEELTFLYRWEKESARRTRDVLQRAAKLDALQKFVTFLQKHPDVPLPMSIQYGMSQNTYLPQHLDETETKAEMARIARELIPFEKVSPHADSPENARFGMKRVWFGRAPQDTDGSETVALTFQVLAERTKTCEAKVVGKKLVKRHVEVTPAVYEDQEVLVDDVEWDCGPILGS